MSSIFTTPGQKECDEQILQLRIRQFMRDFAPEDKRDNAQFVADLHMIVRQAMMDGAEAATKQLTSLMMTMPIVPPVLKP